MHRPEMNSVWNTWRQATSKKRWPSSSLRPHGLKPRQLSRSAPPGSEPAAATATLRPSRTQSGPAGGARSARYSAADWYIEARRYHQGDGVPANYTEAVRLYQIAASSGDPQARRMLAQIFSRPAPDGTVDVTWMQQLAAIDMGPGGGLPAGTARAVAPQGWQRDP